MKIFIFKLVTFVEILSIVSANSMATVVYASDQIADVKTSQDNVSISATINDSNDTRAEINSDVKLKLNVSVQNTGYLKDIKVTLDGNNYELNNEDDIRYSNDSGEQVSYLSYQIRIDCEQTVEHTALENVEIIGEKIDDLMKSERYWCMRRVGSFTKQPHYNDNNVMYGYLRYECNVDINTNTIYRRY